jgi:hypothetical protein
MKYILLLAVFPFTSQQGGALDHVEFNNRDACEQAKIEWYSGIGTRKFKPPFEDEREVFVISGKPVAICVPKGEGS